MSEPEQQSGWTQNTWRLPTRVEVGHERGDAGRDSRHPLDERQRRLTYKHGRVTPCPPAGRRRSDLGLRLCPSYAYRTVHTIQSTAHSYRTRSCYATWFFLSATRCSATELGQRIILCYEYLNLLIQYANFVLSIWVRGRCDSTITLAVACLRCKLSTFRIIHLPTLWRVIVKVMK